ncbi:hypothetical protein BHM03_00051813, partial [Ensete ventricosum]
PWSLAHGVVYNRGRISSAISKSQGDWIIQRYDRSSQYDESKFDYSITAAESSWEPRGVLQP